MATNTATQATGESELWSAIAAFERILEVMPTDRLALETLADAYQKLGDLTRASEYLGRLTDVVVHDHDTQAAQALIEKLKLLSKDDNAIKAKSKLETMLAKSPALSSEPKAQAGGARKSTGITQEISLAWDLLQAGQISQEDYGHIVQDLSESSSKRVDVPVTVLHALHDRHFKGLERVIGHLSRTSNKPVIPLSSFEVVKDTVNLLPMEFMAKRGAIAFETMGQDVLVAVLNPMDKDLQEDVKRVTKRRCHFYIAGPGDYDNTLASIRKMLSPEKQAN